MTCILTALTFVTLIYAGMLYLGCRITGWQIRENIHLSKYKYIRM